MLKVLSQGQLMELHDWYEESKQDLQYWKSQTQDRVAQNMIIRYEETIFVLEMVARIINAKEMLEHDNN